METSKATQAAILYAQNHYSGHHQKGIKFAYNIKDSDTWKGVISFGDTVFLAPMFDKWSGQVYEMQVSLEDGTDKEEAILVALDSLKKEAPHVDLVVCRGIVPLFEYAGRFGDGKQGAFIVNGERLHPKAVKEYGWRKSVLWLREHIDRQATQFDRLAKDMFIHPMTEEMKKRTSVLLD